MDDMNAFERQLAAKVTRMAGPDPHFNALEIARSAATQSPSWRFQSVFSATKFVVAGAIVALFGGFLLAVVLTTQEGDEAPQAGSSMSPGATSSARVMLPPAIPDGIESGTLDTPLGQARWVHLRGDDTSTPLEIGPIAVPGGGFVSVVQRGSIIDDRLELWRSPDLIRWTPEPAPIQAARGELSFADGDFWFKTTGPVSLRRSSDSFDWVEVNLEGLASPGPNGHAWQRWPGTPVAQGGVTIVPLTYIPDYSMHFLGLDDEPGGNVSLVQVESGVYEVPDRGDEPLATIRFEDAGDGLRVIDLADGMELAFHEGVTMEFIERWASREPLKPINTIARLSDDRLVDLDLPDPMYRAKQAAFVIDESGFVAYSHDRDGPVHIHRSEDGRTWTGVGIVGDESGEPSNIQGVGTQAGSIVIRAGDEDWTSADGVAWEMWRELDAVDRGLRYDPHGDGMIRYQPRGEAPVAIALDELTTTGSSLGDRATARTSGVISLNTVYSSFLDSGADPRHLWIITFDDIPA